MAYDSARSRVVLFGGTWNTTQGDTWEWDGAAWSLRSQAGPAPRYDHAMAFDAARQRAVIFGGRNNAQSTFADTWEWDGAAWTLALPGPAGGPGFSGANAMAYDSARGRVFLFGGEGSDSTWEWNGAIPAWTLRASSSPTPRTGMALAYDAARGKTVLFGGQRTNSSSVLAELWTWDGSAALPPTITQQPASQNLASPAPVVLHITATGSGPLTYRWRKGGGPLSDGGTISGAATDTLRIDPSGYSDSGTYDAIVMDACQIPVRSAPASVQVSCPSYYANCDNSTTVPILNVMDFICFQTLFAAGCTDPQACYANCDGSTTPPFLNVNDFLCFQLAFTVGCQ
jgi:hypothetical protein